MYQSMFFVLSGPSGVGKSTILKHLLEVMPDVGFPVSHTSRQPRAGETDGVEYYFSSSEAMTRMVSLGELLECSTSSDGTMYGLSKYELCRMRRYPIVVTDLDPSGARAMRKHLQDAVTTIMIVPEHSDDLYTRLKKRGTENQKEIARRIGTALAVLSAATEYDYVIISRSIEESTAQLIAIIQAVQLRTSCHLEHINNVIDDLSNNMRKPPLIPRKEECL